ncbi:hypothetical protein B0T09DRAFT_97740 [Sordaria sp. MPI-SDFR-AT-0083]|nr:hypothetical protein B0T09DRAFT_97740 [Sordaria sp. MPI-SDFR-AT-0083]
MADTLIVDHLQLTDPNKDKDEIWKQGEQLCRWMDIVLQYRTHLHTSASTGWIPEKLFSKQFFAAVLCAQVIDSELDGRGTDAGRWERESVEELWAGFMAYCGYLDRLLDVAQWCKEYQPDAHDELHPNHQSVSPMHPMMVAVPPAILKTRHVSSSNRPPPQPHLHDEENIKRFCRLWGFTEDESLYISRTRLNRLIVRTAIHRTLCLLRRCGLPKVRMNTQPTSLFFLSRTWASSDWDPKRFGLMIA